MADLGSRAADIVDKMAAGLRAGNVHAVKDVVQELRRRGFDPDIHLRAVLPLLERTLLTLIARGKQHHEQTDFPDHSFRTVLHILDTLNPADWPELAQLLDDHKQDIIRDLLLRMREGWTASALIAVHDLQRWGRRWPELATIERTAQDDVDREVDESRDDYSPSTENLLRYLRQDLDKNDYDAALEIIGELAWTDHPGSKDLTELLNSNKRGLMRAMLTTMSSNDREGVQYSMPQYLSGFAKFGVHWPEFETIERSLDAMSKEQRDDVTEDYAFGKPAPSEINELFAYLESHEGYYAVLSLYRLADADLDPSYAEDILPYKTLIIRGMLEWAKEDPEWPPIVLGAIDTLRKVEIDWPELDSISKSALSDYNQLTETNPVYVKQDAERAVRGVSSKLEKMRKAGLSWEAYYQLIDALYGVLAVNRSYADLTTPVLEHYKTDILRTLLWSIKTSLEQGRHDMFIESMFDAFARARVNWPEIDAIKRSMRARAEQSAGIAESNMNPHQLRYITKTLDNLGPWKAADAMIQQGLRYDSNPEIKALWDANKDRTIIHMLKLIKADPNHTGVPMMIKDFKTIGLPWSEIDSIARSISAGIAEAWSANVRESITVGEESPEELIAQLEQDIEAADYEAALHTLDDLYFQDPQDTAMLLDTHKPGIMRELLKFIKDARTADPVDRAMATRIVKSLRKHGARWPELAVITKSLKAIDDIHEAWSKKYKKSINCSHPKGFSQRAHCAGRRKRRAGGKTKSKSVSEAISGQHRFIRHIANHLKDELEQGDWTSANYTVQRLNQTDPREVQDIFEPLAPLLARMAEADPVGNLRQMSRIMGYIDHAYPEVTAVYDKHKTEIMRYLLGEMREPDRADTVRWMIRELRDCGVDWPEFKVITRSLLESAVRHFSKREVHPAGYDQIVNVFRRKLEDGGSRGIFFVMFWAEQWGIDMREWPELDEMVQDHKDLIVKDLLTGIMERGAEGWSYAADMLDRLRNIGIDWPEMKVIQRSLDAERPHLTEDGMFESRSQWRDQISMARQSLSSGDLDQAVKSTMHAVQRGFPREGAAALFDRYQRQIRQALARQMATGSNVDSMHLLNLTNDLVTRIGMNAMWLDDVRREIKRRMHSERQSVTEEFGTFEDAMERIASHMSDMSVFLLEENDLWLVGPLSDIYVVLEEENLNPSYWPRPADWDIDLQANKTHFVKGILEAIKLGEGDEAVQAVHMLRDYWHVTWPELDIIFKSANADKNRDIYESLLNDSADARHTVDRFLETFVHDINLGKTVDAIVAMSDAIDVATRHGIDMPSAQSLDFDAQAAKDDIMHGLLRLMTLDLGRDWERMVGKTARFLRDQWRVEWPDLDVILLHLPQSDRD